MTPFSRKHHQLGLFRDRFPDNRHFKNIISVVNTPQDKRTTPYLKDGPNATIAVLNHLKDNGDIHSKSIIVNGKSDGNTKGDYGTATLHSLIPYIMTKGQQLKTMVIGIGTGISAGVLSSAKRVSKVDVIEISSAMIDSVEFMAPENLNFHKNSKTTIHQNDAFQFLKVANDKYDIIVSEPSNPWFVGIENLYTKYFYNLAKSRMTRDAIFVQFSHTYSNSKEILTTILSNLKVVFKNITIYHTSPGDIALVASNRSNPFEINAKNILLLQNTTNNTQSNFKKVDFSNTSPIESGVRKILDKIGIQRVSDLNLYRIYNSKEIDVIIETNPSFHHEIFHPKLNKESYFSFYKGHKINIDLLLNPNYKRILKEKNQNFSKRERLEQIIRHINCNEKKDYLHFPCFFLIKNYKFDFAFKNIKSSSIKKRILAYSLLRNRGLIKKDLPLFQKAFATLPAKGNKENILKTSKLIFNELLSEREYELAKILIKKLKSKKYINQKKYEIISKTIAKTKKDQEKLLEHLRFKKTL